MKSKFTFAFIGRAVLLLLLSTFNLQLSTGFAQVPGLLSYQGRVAVGTVNFDGSGQFKFALVNSNASTSFWSNDGSSAAGSQPATAVTLTVTKGLYSVLLGDTNLPQMTASIPITTFTNSDVRLRVWFNDGTNGFQLLTPDQRLGAVGYALAAAAVPNGSINSNNIAAGAIGTAQLAAGAVTAANIATGQVVKNLDGLTDGITIVAGANIRLNTNASTLTISTTNTWNLIGNAGANPTNGAFVGTTDNQPLEFRVGGTRALRLEPNVSGPNVIGGAPVNFVTIGVVGATIAGGGSTGNYTNRVFASYGTVGGGANNVASGDSATVGGGRLNTASGTSATVSGGAFNSATNNSATVGGGTSNTAGGDSATVGGGNGNNASGIQSTIGGGVNNTATNTYATVGGGLGNLAGGYAAIVSGGYGNSATNSYATVGGGIINLAGGAAATVGGGGANTATNNYATVGGGNNNAAGNLFATVGGGSGNIATGVAATVCGGSSNTATNSSATISGGSGNIAGGSNATVPGGSGNTASGAFSFAAGVNAQAIHNGAFVWADNSGGPFQSTNVNQFSARALGGVRFVTGGAGMTLDGQPISTSNQLTNLNASNITSGTLADARLSANVALLNAGQNTFAGDIALGGVGYRNLQLSGGNSTGFLYGAYNPLGDGIHLGYNFFYDAGAVPHIINAGGGTSRITVGYGEIILAVGGINTAPNSVMLDVTVGGVCVNGTVSNCSDRNVKQDFAPVSSAQILDKVAQLPVSEWSYKMDSATRHIGAMAQDFYAAFKVGADDRHIATVDEEGVALAAMQGLNEKVEDRSQKAEISMRKLEARNAELTKQNESLEKRLEALEKIIGEEKNKVNGTL